MEDGKKKNPMDEPRDFLDDAVQNHYYPAMAV